MPELWKGDLIQCDVMRVGRGHMGCFLQGRNFGHSQAKEDSEAGLAEDDDDNFDDWLYIDDDGFD